MHVADNSPSNASRLSRHCGILNISQPYSLQRLFRGISLLFYMQMMFVQQRKHIWASMACYENSIIFYMLMMFVPHLKHTYGPPWPVTKIDLLFYL
jgi:hypothetical protein